MSQTKEVCPEIDCYGCVYDTEEETCAHPLAGTVDFYSPTMPECYTKLKAEDAKPELHESYFEGSYACR